MTRLRQRIAERLKDAQNTAAMLTTFNEVDMGGVMNLRSQHKESFEKKYGVKLGRSRKFRASMPRSTATTSSIKIITISAWRSARRRDWWCR
jgi:hypothetical protein